jgi:hypothetical protein
MIEDDLSRVEESEIKSTYKLCVEFEKCDNKGEKRACKFIPTSNYHKEEEIIKSIKTDYARNSYRDEFSDFLPCSYSRASSRTCSSALSRFSHGPNHHLDGFGSRENNFVPRHFGYGPHPHHDDRFLCRSGFPTGVSHTHIEPRHLHGLCFPHHGSRPTGPNGEV